MPFFSLKLKDLFALVGLYISHCRFLIVLCVLIFRVLDAVFLQILHLCRYSKNFFAIYYIVCNLLLCLPNILCLRVIFFFDLPLDSPPSNFIITNFLEICKSVKITIYEVIKSAKITMSVNIKSVKITIYERYKKCQNYYIRDIEKCQNYYNILIIEKQNQSVKILIHFVH